MTAKQREDLKYISGWALGLSYNTDQPTAEGLVDISECIDHLLLEDEDESKKVIVPNNSSEDWRMVDDGK